MLVTFETTFEKMRAILIELKLAKIVNISGIKEFLITAV